MPEPVITTASRICWPLTVGVLVDGIEVACAPNYESARACAAELRAQPEMAASIRDEPREPEDDRRAATGGEADR